MQATNLVYQGTEIQRREDGYLYATLIAKAHGRNANEWKRNSSYWDYCQIISRKTGTPTEKLVEVYKKCQGRGNSEVWIHPKLFPKFARWLSVDFELWCEDNIVSEKSGLRLKGSEQSREDLLKKELRKSLCSAVEEMRNIYKSLKSSYSHDWVYSYACQDLSRMESAIFEWVEKTDFEELYNTENWVSRGDWEGLREEKLASLSKENLIAYALHEHQFVARILNEALNQ